MTILLLLSPALVRTSLSQTVPVDGITDNTPAVHAFTNAAIVTAPGSVIPNGTLVIRDGVIESVGSNVTPPPDARIRDMEGRTIYPGFIDAWTDVGMKKPRVENERGNHSWNPQVRAHIRAEEEFVAEEDGREKLRSQGFTTVLSVPTKGIFRGQAALVTLGDGSVSDRMIRGDVAHAVSLTRSQELGFGYPTSPAGVIALIRQTLYDADWYEQAHRTWQRNPEGLQRPESNASLAALREVVRDGHPLFFETRSEEQIQRALRVTGEFPVTPWILGNGHEYKILDVLTEHTVPLVLPLDFPEPPEVGSPEDALNQSLASLRHWYLAPENPARVAGAGIPFSLTTARLSDPSRFLANLRKAVEAGLDPETALAALTVNPARMLGIEATHGSIQGGKSAHFFITNGDLFENETRILDVWVDGDRFVAHTEPVHDPAGTWQLVSADGRIEATLSLEQPRPGRYSGNITIDGRETSLSSVRVQQEPGRLMFDFPSGPFDMDGLVRMTASLSGDKLYGWAEVPGRQRLQWRGVRTEADLNLHPDSNPNPNPNLNSNSNSNFNSKQGDDTGQSDTGGSGSEEGQRAETVDGTDPQSDPGDSDDPPKRAARDLELADLRPSMEYGLESKPEQPRHVLVRNATIWTMGPEGILENADLLVTRGKVAEVGRDLRAPRGAVEIDGTGKHVTPGLIDPHIHSGLDGVNEVGNAIVPEVRMADASNINNIWMYRQLAGGLTTAQVLHGSANPIGAQNIIVKMRWGSLSDEQLIEDAPRTVKFALGENPKRVGTDRYPETRMGVEQIIADRFRMARDYEARRNRWEQNGEGLPPRRDLRMDALVDILNEDVIIQAHCYRQDEILALIRLAEEFDMTIESFHHGVEAYKVAPEIAAHGSGAVVWTDWSSFKIEAYDATVYNARLLHEAGVLTSLHSDNSHIASRMNWEAAKMVRAGLDPETALSMVTTAPAKILGIDHRVGSLEPDKDGDFVIWSGDPLSTLTKAEQTWVDGRKYFDLEDDTRRRQVIEKERALLIERILEEKND